MPKEIAADLMRPRFAMFTAMPVSDVDAMGLIISSLTPSPSPKERGDWIEAVFIFG